MQRQARQLVDRVRRMPPHIVDQALAAVVVVVAAIEAAVAGEASAGARIAYFGLASVIAGAAWVRRRAPIAATLVGFATLVAFGLLPREMTDVAGFPFLVVLFLVFSMSLRTGGRRLIATSAAAVVVVGIALATDRYDDTVGDVLFAPSLFVVAPVAVGQMLRSRAALTEALREKAYRAARGRELHAQQAASEERARVAGELHDVVAHALGAMTVQASAARRLAASDPARAEVAFGAVESTGREALAELRALLGVLRREDEDLALAPQPRLANVQDLLRRTAAAGLPAELSVHGEPPGELPAGVDLTAYRVVQEALGEALRHGGAGRARVKVHYADGEVRVEVFDDGSTGEARRLLGMQERVRVYGGSLQAGPGRDGGHRVRARLPVEITS